MGRGISRSAAIKSRAAAFAVNDTGGHYFRPLGHRIEGEFEPAAPGRSRQLREAFARYWERARACTELRALGRRLRLAGIARQIVEIEAVGAKRAVDPGAAVTLADGGMAGNVGPTDRAFQPLDDPVRPVARDPRGQADRLGAGQASLDDGVEQGEVGAMGGRFAAQMADV